MTRRITDQLVAALAGMLLGVSVCAAVAPDAWSRVDPQPTRGTVSWYCLPGRSACTAGYPADGLYAAAGPALRWGDWRGRSLTLTAGDRSVRVTLIDWCACPDGRLIDLYASAFRELAPLDRGIVRVVIDEP
jgi:hypothetical protein